MSATRKANDIDRLSNAAWALNTAIISFSVELSIIIPFLRYICLAIQFLNRLESRGIISRWLSVNTPAPLGVLGWSSILIPA